MLVATPGQTATYTRTTTGSSSSSGVSASVMTKKSSVKSNSLNKNSNSTVTSVTNYYPIIATTTTANTISNSSTVTTFTINALQQQQQHNHVLGRDMTSNNRSITSTIMKTLTASSGILNTKANTSASSMASCSSSADLSYNARSRSSIFNESSGNTATNLMKSLTVRLNRGTETIKATVQRALEAASVVSHLTSNRSLQERHKQASNHDTKALSKMSLLATTATVTATTFTFAKTTTAATTNVNLSALKFSDGGSSDSLIQSDVVPNNYYNGKTNSSKNNNNNNVSSTSLSVLSTNSNISKINSIKHNINIDSSRSPSKAFHELYTIPPTIYHRYPNECIQMSSRKSNNKSDSNRTSTTNTTKNNTNNNTNNDNINNNNKKRSISTDSLNMEMCHFKPIRSAPNTSWRSGNKSRSCTMSLPKLLKPITIKFHVNEMNCDVKSKWKMEKMKRLQMNMNVLNDNRNEYDNDNHEDDDIFKNIKPKLSSSSILLTRLLTAENHYSAFVCLREKMKDNLEGGRDKDMEAGENEIEERGLSNNRKRNKKKVKELESASTSNRSKSKTQMPPPLSSVVRKRNAKNSHNVNAMSICTISSNTKINVNRLEQIMHKNIKTNSKILRRSIRSKKSSTPSLKVSLSKSSKPLDSQSPENVSVDIPKSFANIVDKNGLFSPNGENLALQVGSSSNIVNPSPKIIKRFPTRKSKAKLTTQEKDEEENKKKTKKETPTKDVAKLLPSKLPAIRKRKLMQSKTKNLKSKVYNSIQTDQSVQQNVTTPNALAVKAANTSPTENTTVASTSTKLVQGKDKLPVKRGSKRGGKRKRPYNNNANKNSRATSKTNEKRKRKKTTASFSPPAIYLPKSGRPLSRNVNRHSKWTNNRYASPPLTRGRLKHLMQDGFVVNLSHQVMAIQFGGK